MSYSAYHRNADGNLFLLLKYITDKPDRILYKNNSCLPLLPVGREHVSDVVTNNLGLHSMDFQAFWVINK